MRVAILFVGCRFVIQGMKLQKQFTALMEDKARLEEECSVQLSPEEMQAKLMAKVGNQLCVAAAAKSRGMVGVG